MLFTLSAEDKCHQCRQPFKDRDDIVVNGEFVAYPVDNKVDSCLVYHTRCFLRLVGEMTKAAFGAPVGNVTNRAS